MKPVIENVLTSQRNTQAVKTVLFLKRKYFFYQKDSAKCHIMIVVSLIEIKQEVPDFIIFIHFVTFHNSSTCRCITFAPPPNPCRNTKYSK